MSYYRYITGVYKSYWPGLNRTLRSSSVPRSVPDLDCGSYGRTVSGLAGMRLTDSLAPGMRLTRSTSLPPTQEFYSSSAFLSRYSVTPFRDRATSVQPTWVSTLARTRSATVQETSHYTDFDCKVLDYMGQLDRQHLVRSEVSQARPSRDLQTSLLPNDSSSSRYNFYDGNKSTANYLYNSSSDVLGSWKHYSRSSQTLKSRNDRATSPLVSRGLDRYYGTQKRVDFLGDVSSGSSNDFRHYNYRPVPYLGGSDHMKYMPRYLDHLNEIPNQRFRYGSELKC